MQILFIHRAGGFLGDRITVENYLKFLKEKGFDVFETCVPSMSPRNFEVTRLNSIRCMLCARVDTPLKACIHALSKRISC